MYTATAQQMQQIDDIAIKQCHIPSLALMDRAGHMVAQDIRRYLYPKKNKSVLICCGCGNNAGDGFVIARLLHQSGINTKVIYLTDPEKLKSDALINYYSAKACGVDMQLFSGKLPEGFTVIVDALFGVGLSRDVEGEYRDAINFINQIKAHTIAVDVPSGLDATTGKILGIAVKANKTITFSLAKTGFYQNDGPECAGRVKVVSIGISDEVIEKALLDK